MKPFYVVDNFVADPDAVRQSALVTGFGTWRPSNTIIGYANYDGVGFTGDHATLIKALVKVVERPVYPCSMIFRVTGAISDPSRVHSDRMFGQYSCIVYLSHETDGSGTGFFRHKETGALEQEPLNMLVKDEARFAKLKADMDEGAGAKWDQVHFVEGIFNRALIFHAPFFHARHPKHGSGTTPENGRMVWVCHFNVD